MRMVEVLLPAWDPKRKIGPIQDIAVALKY